MGTGIDLAREHAPHHAALLDNLKDQLLLVFINRLGGVVDGGGGEIDATGGLLCMLGGAPETGVFHFEVRKKQ